MTAAQSPSAMQVAAARAMCQMQADACSVNRDDLWQIHGEDFLREAAEVLAAAGAPELLEACQAMAAWDHAEKNAKPYDEDGGKGFYERMAMCAEAFDKARAAIAKATGGAS